jgi:hypothetical protein
MFRLRSPAEYFIKALIVHPDAYTTEEIKERVEGEDLDWLSLAYIDWVRTRIPPWPEPFYPHDCLHLASSQFIHRERINRAFQTDLSMRAAGEAKDKPRVREFIESMMLAQVPYAAIADCVTRKYKTYCTVEVLEVYKHYYWNIDLLDNDTMRILLQWRVDNAANNIPVFKGMGRALRGAYYKSARKVAADLPHSPSAATLAQMRLGMSGSKQDLEILLYDLQHVSSRRAVEAVYQDGPGDSQKALNYLNIARGSSEMLQMTSNPQNQLLGQLESIALRTENKPLPNIKALSAGQHTVDLAPLKDPKHDDPSTLEPGPGPGEDRK